MGRGARLVFSFALGGRHVQPGTAGHRLGCTGAFTRADAKLYGFTGLVGLQLAASTLLLADVEHSRGVAGMLAGGGLVGLGTGAALVHGRDFSTSEVNLTIFGTYAGSLAGAGLAAIGGGTGDAGAVLHALGAAAGFGITYRAGAPDARRRAHRRAAADEALAGLQLRMIPTLTPVPNHESSRERLRPQLTVRASF